MERTDILPGKWRNVSLLALATLLATCDLCINAVPTFAGQQMAIFEACRQAGKPYVDYGGMGVLGPTRMDYPGTIANVAAVALYIGEVLGSR